MLGVHLMSEFRQKAVPGIVGIFCLFTALFLLTEGSQTYDSNQWESDELITASVEEGSESTIFSNEKPPVTVQTNGTESESSDVDNDGKSTTATESFSPVKEDSWVRHAVAELASEELPDLEGDITRNKPVTRYELAVIIARVIEKLQGGNSSQVVETSLAKVAILEKLSLEFRKELDILGVSGRRFNARLSSVEQKVGSLDRSVDILTSAVAKVEKKTKTISHDSKESVNKVNMVKGDIELLQDMVAQQNSQVEKGDKQIKNLGDIVSRLLVKVALNDARLQDVTPDGVEKSRRDLGAIARAVSGLQKKMDGISAQSLAQDQRLDAFSRKIELRPQAQIPAEALSEVKGLLKEFFTSYETRLRTVERKAM